MAMDPGMGLFCQRRLEEGSMVTSHKQMHSCNALVAAVDISTHVGACIPVSGLGNAERAAGVIAEYILFGLPFNFGLP